MHESILESIRIMIGGEEYGDAFTPDIITHINNALSEVHQLGGIDVFIIEDAGAAWSDCVTDPELYSYIKSYVYNKTKLAFDPPASATLVSVLEKNASRAEWNILVWVEHHAPTAQE